MAESTYIFTNTQFESELKRLQLLEKIFDPVSHKLISATGINIGWHCLEVGAGAGSIMKWMSQKVATLGKVTAIDLDTRFLKNTASTNINIVEADINQITLTDVFDLIHARNMLIHTVDYQATITTMLRLLKPGGWLVLEEPDFSAARFVSGTQSEHQSVIEPPITGREGFPYRLLTRLPR